LDRQVNHWKTNLRIIRASSLQRQGRGWHIIARTFARFRMDDPYDGMCLVSQTACGALLSTVWFPDLRRDESFIDMSIMVKF
jgi:hypothetical protein